MAIDDDVQAFRDALVGWFEREAVDYPWRRTSDPYAVLVSEVMLQQTRVAVVFGKGYYERFLQSFPDVYTLANAEEADLLRAWEGLGYYRRARQLQATARAVVDLWNGIFPCEEKDLRSLPGIGPYTAAALRSFAFDAASPLVDGNVQRVFARLFNDSRPIDQTEGIQVAWQRAGMLLDEKRPRSYNAGLMELGQKICRVGRPDCLLCPVARWCMAEDPEMLPVKANQKRITELAERAILTIDDQQRCLMAKESGGRKQGFWRLPFREKMSEREKMDGALLWQGTYSITRYKVHLSIYEGVGQQAKEGECWIPIEDLEKFPISAPYRRALRQLL